MKDCVGVICLDDSLCNCNPRSLYQTNALHSVTMPCNAYVTEQQASLTHACTYRGKSELEHGLTNPNVTPLMVEKALTMKGIQNQR